MQHIIKSGRSATSIAKELGINTKTVCKWVRDYKRKNNIPSYAESKGIKRSEPKSNSELILRVNGWKKIKN